MLKNATLLTICLIASSFFCSCKNDGDDVELSIDPSILTEIIVSDCNNLGYSLSKLIDIQVYDTYIYVIDQELGDVFLLDSSGCILMAFGEISDSSSLGPVQLFSVYKDAVALYHPLVKKIIVYDVDYTTLSIHKRIEILQNMECYLRSIFMVGESIYLSCPVLYGNAVYERNLIDTTVIKGYFPTIKHERKWIGGGENVATMIHNEMAFFKNNRGVYAIYVNDYSNIINITTDSLWGKLSESTYKRVEMKISDLLIEANNRILTDRNDRAYQYLKYIQDVDSNEDQVLVFLWNAIGGATLIIDKTRYFISFDQLEMLDPKIVVTNVALRKVDFIFLDRFQDKIYSVSYDDIIGYGSNRSQVN